MNDPDLGSLMKAAAERQQAVAALQKKYAESEARSISYATLARRLRQCADRAEGERPEAEDRSRFRHGLEGRNGGIPAAVDQDRTSNRPGRTLAPAVLRSVVVPSPSSP